MMLQPGGSCLLILLLSLASLASSCEKQRRPNRYLIPDGYVGWVKVYFNVKDAPALPIEDGYYLFKFPASGILRTSSVPEFGVASDEYYYYSDNTRHRLKTSFYGEGGMIWGGYDGSSGTASMGESTENIPEEKKARYKGFFVGTEDVYTKHGLGKENEVGLINLSPHDKTQ